MVLVIDLRLLSTKRPMFFRWATIVLIVLQATALWAQAPAPRTEADPVHPLGTHLTDRYTSDLPQLIERKYIRVLTTYNRTNFFMAKGRLRGMEYALLNEYRDSLNRKISRKDLKVVFEFIPVARDQLIPKLVAGYGDIAAAGLTDTEARRQQVAFTRPYISGIDEVLVSHKTASPIEDAMDLSGQTVFVRSSSSYFESLQSLNRRLRKKKKRPVRILTADENLETEDILELVNSGAVARTICDSHIAALWADVLGDIRVNDAVAVRKDSAIAWAVRKENPELKASLNDFIRTHRQGTRLGNIFFQRYYKKTTWVKNPLAEDGDRRLAKYAPVFKRYGKKYDFDWRLIGAMAYQESGLDPTSVSGKGAVGIMQVRPQTAADPHVNIPDVHSLENNVHAAVKYLAFLRRHYFSEPVIRPRDQVRFSLAAYNAGPVKIRRARKLASEMGLDPNRWFRNVEMAMLKIVGQETVRYVSSINKYYVIYSYVAEQLEKREAVMETIDD